MNVGAKSTLVPGCGYFGIVAAILSKAARISFNSNAANVQFLCCAAAHNLMWRGWISIVIRSESVGLKSRITSGGAFPAAAGAGAPAFAAGAAAGAGAPCAIPMAAAASAKHPAAKATAKARDVMMKPPGFPAMLHRLRLKARGPCRSKPRHEFRFAQSCTPCFPPPGGPQGEVSENRY